MKNIVVNEVYHTLIATTSANILFMSKTFFSHHLLNKDGKGPMELLKGEKIDQMLLKFAPFCVPLAYTISWLHQNIILVTLAPLTIS
jgi:hypothetical protein